ncbi:MAG: hypothetical protein WCX16_06660 [Candidatus Omnitrophota bacterium]
MATIDPKAYLDAILPQVPRILSLQDRNPFSKTYGCFDRGFWFHRTSDFPSAIRQMGVETLALLWAEKFEDNPYYQNPRILEWCLAGIRYWIRCQHADGSFDEWYPNERGWAGPTGYLLNAMAESYFLLKGAFPQDLKEPFIEAVCKAGYYLVNYNEEFVLANHHAIALLPIYQAYLITEDKALLKGFEKKFTAFERYCYDEGWCLEYDGADIGYLSATVSFLARLYQYWPDKRIERVVKRAVEFSSFFFYPDGFFGGTIGSRETGHFYHFGYEFWSKKIPLAARMAEEGLKSLSVQKLVSPSTQEDHYVLYRMAEYLKAYLEYKLRPSDLPSLPFEKGDFEKTFPQAGLFVKKVGHFYCVINLARGGIIKAFDCEQKKLFLNDAGWMAKFTNEKVATSKWNDPLYKVAWGSERLSVEGEAHYVAAKTFTPLTMMFFRAFLLLFGWQTSLACCIKALIRKVLMVGARRASLGFKRTIHFQKEGLLIEDEFVLKASARVKDIYLGGETPTRYVPQSRYFQSFELDIQGEYALITDIARLNYDKKISILRNFNFSNK